MKNQNKTKQKKKKKKHEKLIKFSFSNYFLLSQVLMLSKCQIMKFLIKKTAGKNKKK